MTENALWRLLLGGFVLLLAVTSIALFFGVWIHPDDSADLPPCPYSSDSEILSKLPGIIPAIGAYEVIREKLQHRSTADLEPQTVVIAQALSSADPRIASCAKRLGAEKDVESARRVFMRLHRLMEKHTRALEKK